MEKTRLEKKIYVTFPAINYLCVFILQAKLIPACVRDHCHTGRNFLNFFPLHALSFLNDEESGTD